MKLGQEIPQRESLVQKMSSESTREGEKKKWRKILYEDQGVPDNYVDETFLQELRKNCKSLAA